MINFKATDCAWHNHNMERRGCLRQQWGSLAIKNIDVPFCNSRKTKQKRQREKEKKKTKLSSCNEKKNYSSRPGGTWSCKACAAPCQSRLLRRAEVVSCPITRNYISPPKYYLGWDIDILHSNVLELYFSYTSPPKITKKYSLSWGCQTDNKNGHYTAHRAVVRSVSSY